VSDERREAVEAIVRRRRRSRRRRDVGVAGLLVLAGLVVVGLAGTRGADPTASASSSRAPVASAPVASAPVASEPLSSAPVEPNVPAESASDRWANSPLDSERLAGEHGDGAATGNPPMVVVDTYQLAIETEPPGAAVTATTTDGDVFEGETPFRRVVEKGTVAVEVSADGYQTITETFEVDRDVAVAWELGPPRLLHRKLGEFATGAHPKQVAFTPDGTQIWVTLLGGRGVEVFDAATFERLAEITLGDQGGAVEIVFAPDGATAYVSQMETASVFEIDTGGLEVRRQLSTGGSWSKVMALSPDATTLYVANWISNDVSEIDLTDGELRRRIPTVRTPRGLYPTEDGERLFVAGFGSGELGRVDLTTGSTEVVHSTGRAMRHLSGDSARLYASDMGENAVFVVDIDDETTAKLADTNANPNTIDLSPDGRVLYVSNRGANNPASYYLPGPEWGSVLAFDASTGQPLDAIVGGNQTTGLDVAPDGSLLAFSDFLDDRVQVYEIPSSAVLVAGDGGRFASHRADLAK
jgi:sugar lactone lactonase YvrE